MNLIDYRRYYVEGIGTRKDPVRAYMWWTIAASWGDPDAMPVREMLASILSESQITEATGLARQWAKDYQARLAKRYRSGKKEPLVAK